MRVGEGKGRWECFEGVLVGGGGAGAGAGGRGMSILALIFFFGGGMWN